MPDPGLVQHVRVAHLSSAHPVGDPRIYAKECRSLYEAGYDAFMVGIGESSNPPAAPAIIGIRPSGSRLLRMTLTAAAAVRAGLRAQADVFHLHDVELIPFGLLLKLMGKRVIFDNHEFVVEDIRDKPYLSKPLRHLFAGGAALALWFADRFFDAIVVAAPAMVKTFHNPNTVIINNYAEWDVRGDHHVPFADRKSAVAYIGGIDEKRGIREIVDAMEIVASRMDVELILAGQFCPPELCEDMQKRPGWRHVDYRGVVRRSEVIAMLNEALAGLVIFHNTGNHRNASPNKLFEYMVAGLPVIMPDFPSWVERFGVTGACLPVDPLNPSAIAERICWLLQHRPEAEAMGRRGRESAQTCFHWNQEKEKLIALYEKITSTRSKSSVRAESVVKQAPKGMLDSN